MSRLAARRNLLATGAGFLFLMVSVSATTALASALLGRGAETPTAWYLSTNLVLSLACAVVSGVICARLAHAGARTPALVLAGGVVALAIGSAVAAQPTAGQPAWYGWLIGALGVVGILAGDAASRTRIAARARQVAA